MPGNGKYIIKNLAIGPYAPQGQDIKVTIEDIVTEPAQKFTLQLGDTLRYLPKTEVLRITIRPTLHGMKKVSADIKNAKQATDTWRYIIERHDVYGLTVVPQKNFIPMNSPAWTYQPITRGRIIDA